MHAAYVEAGRAMQQEDPRFMFSDEPWEALPLTLQNANRQLHRHAQMRLRIWEGNGGRMRAAFQLSPPCFERLSW
ncbi:hypothetical protein AJ88_20970 [Mesorhizobium amorphae CCBAU 01583]|nr:hypothetical protein AJ88_20970 [Mesorhizobium amorphae CCBAU 01583]